MQRAGPFQRGEDGSESPQECMPVALWGKAGPSTSSFFYFFAMLQGLQDHSSPTTDQTQTFHSESTEPTNPRLPVNSLPSPLQTSWKYGVLCESFLGFPGGSDSKESPCNAGDPGSIPRKGRSSGEGNGKPTSVFVPGESHGQRSLAGYSLRG